jgi:ribosomal protein S14
MHLSNFAKFNTKIMIEKELYKNFIKFFILNKYKILKSNKIIKVAYRNKYFFKQASTSFFRRSCLRLGNCRSVFRFFKMSRYIRKYYASHGFLVGLRKASF